MDEWTTCESMAQLGGCGCRYYIGWPCRYYLLRVAFSSKARLFHNVRLYNSL